MSQDESDNTRQGFGAELKRVRQETGLSQEQMATRLGMDYAPGGRRVSTGRAAVSAWESGRRVPTAEHLQVYVDLGGDPAILAPPSDAWPHVAQADEPVEAAAAEGATVSAAPSEPPRPPVPFRRGRRWRWLLSLSTAAVAAAGATFLVVAHHNAPQGPVSTWTETTGIPAHTWADATQLTGAGAPLGPRQSVQVLCRVRGYVVQDGDPWWYRLASTPWNDHYYATSDAFYNEGSTSGPVDTGVVVDEQVPVCPGKQ